MTGPIATFRKNANEEVRVSIDDFRGHRLVNIRVWYTGPDGEPRPGKQGVAIRIELLAELRAALDFAAKEGRAAVNNGLVGMGESSLAESGNGET